jgi:outer membrane protein assembly factor BamA
VAWNVLNVPRLEKRTNRSSRRASARSGALLVYANLVAVVVVARASFAADPLNSTDRPVGASPGKESQGEPHNEFNVVPVAGGSTDIGIGGGFFLGWARLRSGLDPYVWNFESAGLITFKPGDSGGVVVPYGDLYAKLTVPRFLGYKARLEIRPSFTTERTIHYYGLGNASSAASQGRPDSYFEYGRTHPQISVDLRFRVIDHLAGRAGGRYTQNWMITTEESKLVSDLDTGSAEVKELLGSLRPHAVALFVYGLQWDDRDNETSTHRGSFDTLDVKLSPGGTDALPYRYGEAVLNARVFVPIWKPRVTLAARAVGDILFGDPPFYELARFDDTYALGGTNGIRGIPAGRYYGKVKLIGNIEVRSEIVTFRLWKKPMTFGVVAFFDGGRVWADTRANPSLDGTGIGLHYGLGGGLRLQTGSAFVLRADLAWSPDATPVGGYFSAGQMF